MYVPQQDRRSAVTFEDAVAYAQCLNDSEALLSLEPCSQQGGTLVHMHESTTPRMRFMRDSHGPRGRQPVRPKGAESIRRAAVVH